MATEKDILDAQSSEREYACDEKDRGTLEWTDADEKRIKRKMDWIIVPTVFVLYLLCFIDRQVP
jgi:hypothetical protein